MILCPPFPIRRRPTFPVGRLVLQSPRFSRPLRSHSRPLASLREQISPSRDGRHDRAENRVSRGQFLPVTQHKARNRAFSRYGNENSERIAGGPVAALKSEPTRSKVLQRLVLMGNLDPAFVTVKSNCNARLLLAWIYILHWKRPLTNMSVPTVNQNKPLSKTLAPLCYLHK